METFDWASYIKEWSIFQIERLNSEQKNYLPPEVIESFYLGYPGATEEQIIAAEKRLGVIFPPSYKDFLKASNGLRSAIKDDIEFYSTEEIDWFAVRNQERIDDWTSDIEEIPSVPDEKYFVYGQEQNCVHLRCEYMQTALEISSDSDGYIYLLNPEIISPDGEWEAWYFGNKLPGAFRYSSFTQMMKSMLKKYQ
ncbi:hypothetical protein NIES2101_19875 [Calothrix sp. HK-06]|nr:hypothetical protein NIES2101_19875 [Calothrix sp. HK-06]